MTEPHLGGPLPVPPSANRTHRTVITVAVVAAALLVSTAVAVGVFLAVKTIGGGLSKAAAERACRTAFSREFQARNSRAQAGASTTVVASVTEIALVETWQTDEGWSINGTVHYTLTTGFVAPVQDTLEFTCTATGDDDHPVTSVVNRK